MLSIPRSLQCRGDSSLKDCGLATANRSVSAATAPPRDARHNHGRRPAGAGGLDRIVAAQLAQRSARSSRHPLFCPGVGHGSIVASTLGALTPSLRLLDEIRAPPLSNSEGRLDVV